MNIDMTLTDRRLNWGEIVSLLREYNIEPSVLDVLIDEAEAGDEPHPILAAFKAGNRPEVLRCLNEEF